MTCHREQWLYHFLGASASYGEVLKSVPCHHSEHHSAISVNYNMPRMYVRRMEVDREIGRVVLRMDLPPRPMALPLLGSIGFLWGSFKVGALPHVWLARAAETHGSVIGIWFGPQLVVVLNGYDTIRKALVTQASDFLDRPIWLPQFKNIVKNGKGIAWSNGEEWRKIRKFTLQHMRFFGIGTDAMEESILEEVDKVVQTLGNTNSEFTSIEDTFQFAVSNVICRMVFGQTFKYDDPTFISLLEMIRLALIGQGFISITNFIPECLYPLFPKENELYQRRKSIMDKFENIVLKLIKSHEETFDENNVRDLLDYYIKVKQDKTSEENLASEPYFNPNNIRRVIFDLFLTGSETTSTVLEWCLLYFIEYPNIQQKCRQHVLDFVGDRKPRLSDRGNLPYVEAFLQDVLRMSNVVPLGVPRSNAARDTFINGFRIPKRTTILANLYSANTDPKYWNNPLEFNPERFLDDKGQLVKTEAFVPLSIGPRNCPGESLARMELFLFVSVLLQRFHFERVPDAPICDFSPDPGQLITLLPRAFKFKAIPRL